MPGAVGCINSRGYHLNLTFVRQSSESITFVQNQKHYLLVEVAMSEETTSEVREVTKGELDLQDDESSDESYQDISGRNINPTKLTALLKARFGIGSYEIHASVSCLRKESN